MGARREAVPSTKRTEDVVRAIRSVWSSLESHLEYTYTPIKTKSKEIQQIHGSKRFHKKCVRDYADILVVLSKKL